VLFKPAPIDYSSREFDEFMLKVFHWAIRTMEQERAEQAVVMANAARLLVRARW
jgi:hypothetical protein